MRRFRKLMLKSVTNIGRENHPANWHLSQLMFSLLKSIEGTIRKKFWGVPKKILPGSVRVTPGVWPLESTVSEKFLSSNQVKIGTNRKIFKNWTFFIQRPKGENWNFVLQEGNSDSMTSQFKIHAILKIIKENRMECQKFVLSYFFRRWFWIFYSFWLYNVQNP